MRFALLIGLLVLLALPGGVIVAQSGGELAYGDDVTGTITGDDPIHEWTFSGSTGDVVTIEMIATNPGDGGLDSLLQLLSPEGELLTENDDASNVTVDSRIEAFPLPDDGTYTIIATRFGLESGLSEGDYSLTLRQVTASDAPAENAAPEGTLGYNEAVTGELNRQNVEDRWQFDGAEGDVITIRMQRSDPDSDLDSFLRLLDDEDRELERNDDGAEGIVSSEIVDFTLPYSGTYTIVATRFGFESGTSSGTYTLEILTDAEGVAPEAPQPEEAEPEATSEPPTETNAGGQTVTYGDFAEGSLSGGGNITQQFMGAAGDVVTISVKRGEGDLNPAVQLQDGSGNILAENDSFNGQADARIVDFVLPQDGPYTINVIAEGSSAGNYVLYLFASEEVVTQGAEPEETPPPIEAPPDLPDLSEAGLVITLAWEGSADLDLEVRAPDGEFINYSNVESDSGGVFGGDANGACMSQQESPSETVYWLDEAPAGDYTIGAAYVFPCDVEGPVTFTIAIMHGEDVEVITGEISEGGYVSYDRTLE